MLVDIEINIICPCTFIHIWLTRDDVMWYYSVCVRVVPCAAVHASFARSKFYNIILMGFKLLLIFMDRSAVFKYRRLDALYYYQIFPVYRNRYKKYIVKHRLDPRIAEHAQRIDLLLTRRSIKRRKGEDCC